MKEFISILISFIFMSVADSIDSAFNNLISIDTIVVWGSFLLLDSILRAFSEIGIYTYRTTRKNEWAYLWFNILFSILIGCIVFLGRNLITNIFNLTTNQKEMLSILLNIYIGYLILGRLSNAIFEIIRLKGKLKLYRKSLIVYYISLITLDTLAYLLTKNLTLLFMATMLSWLISIIYMLYHLKLKLEFPNQETVKAIFQYGVPYSSERLFSRIFLLLYGVLASHLGTDKYSVHTVCYSVCLTLELITNAYQATLMIKVPKGKTYKEQYNICINMRNQCFSLIVILNFVFAFVYLFLSHGSLPLYKCFPYIIFYSFGVFGLYPYETYKTLCITQGKSFILLLGSIVGVIIRFLICFVFMKSAFALFIFGIANFLDFYTRSIIYRIVLFKYLQRRKINETRNCHEIQ